MPQIAGCGKSEHRDESTRADSNSGAIIVRYLSYIKLLFSAAALMSSFALQAGEPPIEPVLRIDPGEHTSPIRRIAADAQGRYLVTVSFDKSARVWDLNDGHLLSTLRVPIGKGNEGKLFAAAMSPDGQTIAVAGWTGWDYDGSASVFIFDRASGQMQRRLSGLSGTVNDLAFSSDGRALAVTLSGSNGLRVFDAFSGSLLGEDRDYGDVSYNAHFSNDGRLVTSSYDGLVRMYQFTDGRLRMLAKRTAPGGKQIFGVRFSPDGRYIAVGFSDSNVINVLDANDLSFSYAPDSSGGNSNLGYGIAWSKNGDYLYAGGQSSKYIDGVWYRYIRRWNRSGEYVDWPVAADSIMSLTPLADGSLVFGSSDPAWGVMNPVGRNILSHRSVLADLRDNQSGFKLSYDGSIVRFGYKVFGGLPAVFDGIKRDFLPADTPYLVAPLSETNGVKLTDWSHRTDPKLNGAAIKLEQYENSRSVALSPDGAYFALGADWKLRVFDRSGSLRWEIPSPGIVWGVNYSGDGRWVVAAYGDGTIRWHRASDGAEQLAFFPHADRSRWVMWTPTGYYDASPGAEDMIGWHLNRGKDNASDFFPASRFRNQFYRPDVLARVFDTGSEGEALRLANIDAGRRTQVVSVAEVLPPVVNIVSPVDGISVSTPVVTLRYNTRTPDDAPVTNIRVRVNGLAVALPDMRNLAIAASAGGEQVINVPIPSQDSEILLFAENRNGISVPASLRLTWAGQETGQDQEFVFKPKLYVLAVGVSKYQNPDFNLGLADKDATDFAHAFQNQEGKLYGKVSVRLLTNETATKEDVLDGLDWLQREVTSRDVGVMFIAGHGMNDNAGAYYFLPYNTDLDRLKRTGVAQSDIKNTLNMLAGKALFFVDTCHAGNALGTGKTRAIGGSTDAFVNELASAENGVIVFSSSTGKQLSQEDPKWGNGAFTKAVVEGLNGKAEIGKSGKITHKGLDYYVTERVKELTHGQQSPVSIAPGGITDFPIAVAGKP